LGCGAPQIKIAKQRDERRSDTPAGAHASAALYSIVETAKANKIDPYQYLRLIFTELPKIPEGGSIEHLLPWNLTPPSVH
jgi:hypothetical protein